MDQNNSKYRHVLRSEFILDYRYVGVFVIITYVCILKYLPWKTSWLIQFDCVKGVHIRSYPGPYFPAFGLNTEYLSVFSPKRENTDQNN